MSEGQVSTASGSFRLVRLIARAMLRSQYRRIEVEGAENVPTDGAVLLVANHFSSLVDSMALLHASPRPASFLAKAPLWGSRVLAFFLDAVGALPVYRPQDKSENEGRGVRANVETFRVCRERLAEGGSLALFPEGVSQPQPRLMPVRTGAARIAIDVGVPVSICPAGVVVEPPEGGQRGTMLIRFGRPFVLNGTEGYASRRAAVAGATRRIEGALHRLLAEAESQGDLQMLRTLRVVWDQERGIMRPRTLAEAHRRHRVFARNLARLSEEAPEQIDALRSETDAYARALDLAGIPPHLLPGRYTFGRVMKFLLIQGPLFLLGVPLALLASFVTWPVRMLGDIIALRLYGGREDVRALCRMLGSGALLIALMVVGGLLVGLLWSPWAGLAVFVGLPTLLAYHIGWRDHSHEVRARVRSFMLLAGGQLRRTLQRHRRTIFERLLAVSQHLGGPDAVET